MTRANGRHFTAAIFAATLGVFVLPATVLAASATLFITEVHPNGSGNGTYAAHKDGRRYS